MSSVPRRNSMRLLPIEIQWKLPSNYDVVKFLASCRNFCDTADRLLQRRYCSTERCAMRLISFLIGLVLSFSTLVLMAQTPLPAPADVKAPPSDAKKTASGLAYKVVKNGTGTKHPMATSAVTVHYTGWTTDGKMFDSSVVRG